MKKGYVNLHAIKLIFIIFLVYAFSLNAIILLTNLIHHTFFKTITLHISSQEDPIQYILSLITMFSLLLYILNFFISFILIIIISSLFSYNCKYLNNGITSHSVGWTIAYFFIPIIGYWKPYQAIKEFYMISQGNETSYSSYTKYILIWWILYLINNVSFRFIGDFETIPLLSVDIVILLNVLMLYFSWLTFGKIFNGIIHRLSSINNLESQINNTF